MIREPLTIDNDTGQVIEQPDLQDVLRQRIFGTKGDAPQPGFGTDQSGNTGFGPTRKLLDTAPILTAPWLTPELAEQEMQIGGFK